MTDTVDVPPILPVDSEIEAALAELGQSGLAVGNTADDLAAGRFALEALAPSRESLECDKRFALHDVLAPGIHGQPSVDVLVAQPIATATHSKTELAPVLFTSHGGGQISGNYRLGLPGLFDIAHEIGAVIVSVDYRLAPEYPYPAAHLDNRAAYQWTVANIESFAGDPTRIVLYGGSAGGNLVAGLCLWLRDVQQRRPIAQMLLYPMLDDRNDSISARQMRASGIWDQVSNQTAWDMVLGVDRPQNISPYAAPARANNLAGLPTTYLEVGSNETFRDETVNYAHKLWSSGTDGELHVWPGGLHGADLFFPNTSYAERCRRTRIDWLRRALRRGPA